MKYYNINGEIVAKDKAFIHVSDLALHRGYSIFDYFRVLNGKPLFIEDYLDRFERSAEQMSLTIPISRTELKQRIHELIQVNEVKECGFKLLLTGGYSADGYHPAPEANLYMMVLPKIIFPQAIIENGMKLITHEYVRHIPKVKMTNYVESLLLQPKVKAANAQDMLYHIDGEISESSRSNFFIVKEDDTLVTTEEDILYGITRKHLLDLAKSHYTIEIRNLHLDEVKAAKEAFICSSAKGAIGIVQIDDWQVGDGKVGAITKHLNALYDAEVSNYIQ